MRHETDMTEAEMLNAVRPRYEAEGFRFVVHPSDEILPGFLRGQRLAAIALKSPGGTIIEVKKRGPDDGGGALPGLAERIAAEKDWNLSVLYLRAQSGLTGSFPAPTPRQIDDMLEETEDLLQAGQNRAVFLSCWILLEALTRLLDRVEETGDGRALSPSQTVQRLASSGYVESDLVAVLRVAAECRNRLVHGDLEVMPRPSEVEALVLTVRSIRDQIYRDAEI